MRVIWDALADRLYTEGVSNGVLYNADGSGVAWNGLISVTENGDPDQETKYFEGRRYYSRSPGSTYAGTISAYTYPDEFEPYIGIGGIATAQLRRAFGFSYQTNNELHIVYNALASPSQRDYQTMTEEINLVEMSWDFTTQPVEIPGGKPTSHVVILLNDSSLSAIFDLETILYGTDGEDILDPDTGEVIGSTATDPALPAITDIIEIFESYTTMRITNNGDDTWTASGPDDVVTILDSEAFQITSDSIVDFGDGTYKVSSF